MKNPINKHDEEMQDYARKWMKSLDKPRFSTNISYFFLVIFLLVWASTLTNQMGYIPLRGVGMLITLGIIAVLILILLATNHILAKIGLSKAIRSALWFSALIGPYISIIAINNWGNSALSHIVGVFSALLGFNISYALDRLFIRNSQSITD
jgi:hypothetical protein